MVREIVNRVQFLVDVGLEYLTLARPAPTLSGGEAQRIRLAAQVGSGLCGVLYVLDEPTIGLHPRDNRKLVSALAKLRDLGNTLLLVEHDRDVIKNADQLLDFGPLAGRSGGEIVARGTPAQVGKARGSVTGPYLSGKKAIAVPTNRRMASASLPVPAKAAGKKRTAKKGADRTRPVADPAKPPVAPGGWLEILGARHNNLKKIDVRIPLGTFTLVTGVSGSGKSSLIEDVLYNAIARQLHRAKTFPGAHDKIRGLEQINKVIRVDQQPLGQTPASNPATFTGAFDLHPHALFATAGCEAPRLLAPPLQLQRSRRAVRKVRRERAAQDRDALLCPTCGSNATHATGGGTSRRHSRCSTTASRSPTCWTCPAARR